MRHGGLNGIPPWEVMMAPFGYLLFPTLSMLKLGWPSFLLTVRPLEPSAVLKFSYLNVKTSALWLFWAHFCFLAFEYIPNIGWSSILCSFNIFFNFSSVQIFCKATTCKVWLIPLFTHELQSIFMFFKKQKTTWGRKAIKCTKIFSASFFYL